jgi:hypothetical protein
VPEPLFEEVPGVDLMGMMGWNDGLVGEREMLGFFFYKGVPCCIEGIQYAYLRTE